MEKVLVLVSITAGIFGIVYVLAVTRHRERMALIDKGISAKIFSEKDGNSLMSLKFGMLFMGIGSGIILGNILLEYTNMSEGVAYWSMIFITGGLSLILNYVIERKIVSSRSVASE